MTKEQRFSDMIDLLYTFSDTASLYQSIPQCYGNAVLYMAEAHMLRSIGDAGEITVTELSRRNSKSKSAVSQMVDKLYQKGLVSKVKNPNDKKQVSITLTEEGKETYEAHKEFDHVTYSKYLERLDQFSEKDIDKICQLLNWVIMDLQSFMQK